MPLDKEQQLSNKLYWTSLFGAFCVVFIHAGVCKIEETQSFSWWFYQMTANGFCRWAVPFFFASAGYNLSRHVNEPRWYLTALRKRVGSLLVPYLAWTLIGSLVFISLHLLANLKAPRPLFTNFPNGWRVLIYFGVYPYGTSWGVLWFVQTLLLMILLSPALVWVVRRGLWVVPVGLLALSYVGLPSMPYNFNPGWIMYFTAGIAARFSPIHIKSKLFGLLIPAGMAWVAYHKLCLLESGAQNFDLTPLPAMIMIVVGLWSLMPSWHISDKLRGLSFPVYVIHPTAMILFCYVMPKNGGFVHYSLTGFLMIVVSVVISLVIRRYERLSLILFGGR